MVELLLTNKKISALSIKKNNPKLHLSAPAVPSSSLQQVVAVPLSRLKNN